MLDRLNQDVLLLIFALCDIHTILSLSSVNKGFHQLAFSAEVWTSIALNLSARGLLDLPDDMEGLSMKDEIMRAVHQEKPPWIFYRKSFKNISQLKYFAVILKTFAQC
ncbi:hypothetical protein FB45DRAFT_1053526 [Roridomyces roridus]|uniref:F-box domain-containing protein n=1 Tax=Roridomyces roridus TaxID=1738132 RepID=A0AAD7CCY7_9AGAR|nr:hypothetical protein FB45DRAFT_1053526 [Roridomyces roridus]